MSRRRARVPRTYDQAFAPRWPLVAGATALLLIVLITGYVSGRFVADSDEQEESALAVESGILVQPPGAPEEEAEPEEEEEEEEPVHPAGIDPELVYVLQNVHGDRVLDVVQAATANGAAIHLWDRHDQENQQWRFVPVDDGYYEIEGVGSGKVLEIAAGGGPGATLLSRTGDPHQHWAPVEVGDGVVRLINRATSQALEAQGGAPDNGTAVVQAPDGGHAHQQWRLLPLG
ncbi:RICIN domain-containing protein [Nocardiopsis sp. NRRL B-16309]|uniref:RICIN domain-containing protein n=1 Tax=Nocardiopsis sp. NRRL B-16309 TaxID=1519494 RepID=UPI0006AF2137|nr:RICIN domain-containing protein [Nocardiopsis sp. NRRL B-16309]KOX19084.1 ricin B lectin [Nocardiopsis sp. NRRL B-16309]